MIYAFIAMFLAFPILSIVWCISNFIEYRKAKSASGSDDSGQAKDKIRHLKTMSVVSLITAIVLTGVIVGTIITFAIGIMYM